MKRDQSRNKRNGKSTTTNKKKTQDIRILRKDKTLLSID